MNDSSPVPGSSTSRRERDTMDDSRFVPSSSAPASGRLPPLPALRSQPAPQGSTLPWSHPTASPPSSSPHGRLPPLPPLRSSLPSPRLPPLRSALPSPQGSTAPRSPYPTASPPSSSPQGRLRPLPPLRSSLPSPQGSTLPWSPHQTASPPSSSPQPQQELITLAPLLSDTPLPRPTHTRLPSIRELFPNFPPELPPPEPPKNPIPDISTLFALLVPRNKQRLPLSDNLADETVRVQICATCRNPDPTMACPGCHLIHYCSSTTCLLQDVNHPPICSRYNKVAETVYAQPFNYSARLELVEILEASFKHQRTRHLLHMAIWHRNEIMRLSGNDPMRIHLDFPFNLLRTGENDAVVSFIRHWAMKSSRRLTHADAYVRSAPGDRTYPVNLDRYEDALAANVRSGTVPLTHLVALCLVKIRIIASINARAADKRHKVFWQSNFGKRLSPATGARLEDFFLRGGRSRDMGRLQVPILARYLGLIRERNPIMEYVMRDARVLQNGPPNGYEASYGEAKEIWEAIGDLFMQVPGYPTCIF